MGELEGRPAAAGEAAGMIRALDHDGDGAVRR
jgi:hypothetical protein